MDKARAGTTLTVALLGATILVGCGGAAVSDPAAAAAPRIVWAGEPGAASRSGADHSTVRPSHTEADVRFMSDMIAHHAQALILTALVEERTDRPQLRLLAHRIDVSQRDEIALMLRWLEDRGEPVPSDVEIAEHAISGARLPHEILRRAGLDTHPGDPVPGDGADRGAGQTGDRGHHSGHAGHGGHGGQAGHTGDHAGMPGMLSGAQLEELAAARDEVFDRLFLEFMIYHHEGALIMVDELFAAPGGGQETEIFTFASHVDADQRMEIMRMRQLLVAR